MPSSCRRSTACSGRPDPGRAPGRRSSAWAARWSRRSPRRSRRPRRCPAAGSGCPDCCRPARPGPRLARRVPVPPGVGARRSRWLPGPVLAVSVAGGDRWPRRCRSVARCRRRGVARAAAAARQRPAAAPADRPGRLGGGVAGVAVVSVVRHRRRPSRPPPGADAGVVSPIAGMVVERRPMPTHRRSRSPSRRGRSGGRRCAPAGRTGGIADHRVAAGVGDHRPDVHLGAAGQAAEILVARDGDHQVLAPSIWTSAPATPDPLTRLSMIVRACCI